MKFNKRVLFIAVTGVIIVLSGCGVTSQDKGFGLAENNVSGVAVDGYLMNALVYVDTNENNKLDIWEPQAITDKDGYFTFNPKTKIMYCDLPLAENVIKHPNCLKMPAGYSEVLIRIRKGYDLTTNEPFTGTLSMRINTSDQRASTPVIATPIMGLLAHMDDTQKTTFFANETDIDANNANLDFLNFPPAETTEASAPTSAQERRTLMKVGLKIHKVADTIAGILDAEFDQGLLDTDTSTSAAGGFFGVVNNMPADASVYAYKAIAEGITGTESVSSVFADISLLEGIVSNTFIKMNAVVVAYNADSDKDFLLPTSNSALFTTIATDLVAFTAMIDVVLNDDSDVATEADLKARMRAIDIVASLMRSKEASDVVTRARALAIDDAYITNLKEATFDIAGTRARFIAKASDAAGLAALDASVASFAGRSSLSDLFSDTGSGFGGTSTPGFDGKTLDMGDGDKSVGISFTGGTVGDDGEPASTGTMKIDATFLGDDFATTKKNEDGTDVLDENGDPVKEPLQLDGTWEQIDEYTMLMNVEIAGATQPVIVKPTLADKVDADGNVVLDSDGKPVQVAAYYFDLGGEQQVWIP